MKWWIYVLVVLAVVVGVLVYFYYRNKLDSEERKLIKFLKKNNGEADPRFLKRKMKVSRDWLEDVSDRLEERGKIVRWGWRAKSLICLKGSVVKNEKRVVKLLKANGGVMGQWEVGKKLGYDRESFSWRMVRKLKAKGVVYVRTRGKSNLLVLSSMNKKVIKKKVKLDRREERLVKILRKGGGEMLDVSLALRMKGADGVIKGLIKKGVVFRWGAKKRNVCLKDMLSEDEERLIGILKKNNGKMMWRELVRKMGYSGNGFHRVLNKLEIKERIVRRKVGRSLEVLIV